MERVLFLVFAASGFSGLVYESIWSHYLRLFLGHAAYAQTLVLAIFMGGMSLGSWICSRLSGGLHRPLLAYALVEGAIGGLGLLFHPLFQALTGFAYEVAMPHLGSSPLGSIFRWALAALLILPQSVLLGTTFPLMSAGMIRLSPERGGFLLAMLYFSNSAGAVLGVLTSGFVLMGLVGLPGTVMAAGSINVLVALTVWLAAKESIAPPVGEGREAVPHGLGASIGWYRLLLSVSLLTGASSFMYEIGWIRMLSLVLGSSTHSFELMLSAFILGLALGGLWVRRRMDRLRSPVAFLGGIQVLMGFLAISTLPLYGNAFELMRLTLGVLNRSQESYVPFLMSSHLIAAMIMLPAAFCAGMTLPLITMVLIAQGHGEKSLGAVYATNTVGAIAGVFMAVHVGMPLLGVKGLVTLGAGLDMAVGLALLWSVFLTRDVRFPLLGTGLGLAAMAFSVWFVRLDPLKMASGVYRHGRLLASSTHEVLYHKDGKTSTVSVTRSRDGIVSLRVNGKVDAAIRMSGEGEAAPDEATMVLLGVLPLALNPKAKTAANVGFGSGLTTHVLLSSPSLEAVDTVEIEPAVLEAARWFGPRVERAFSDPRSRIFLEDARGFFSCGDRSYDIIVSEPSNPWISGVSNLFSDEFYALLRAHLNQGGLLIQWVHLYEMEVELVASVVKALSSHFEDYVIYAADDGNLLIAAKKDGNVGEPDPGALAMPWLWQELSRVSVRTPQDLECRRIGDKGLLNPLFASYQVPANSDFFPFLDLNAQRSRFLEASADAIVALRNEPLPALEMLDGRGPRGVARSVTQAPYFGRSRRISTATALRDSFSAPGGEVNPKGIPQGLRQELELSRLLFRECRFPDKEGMWFESLRKVAYSTIPYLPAGELEGIWAYFESSGCFSAVSEYHRLWFGLLKAMGRRDAQGMALAATALLEAGEAASDGEFLLCASMLGNLAKGDRMASQRLWERHRARLPGGERSLLLRLLVAHAFK